MDEFEKIKAFSEGLAERQQRLSKEDEVGAKVDPDKVDLPQCLSQFRIHPAEETKESKRLLWIVCGLAVLILVGVIVGLSLRVPEMEENEVLIISPTPVPVKVLPENPGGLTIPDTDKIVYQRGSGEMPEPIIENLFSESEQPVLPSKVIEPEDKKEVLVAMDASETLMKKENKESSDKKEDIEPQHIDAEPVDEVIFVPEVPAKKPEQNLEKESNLLEKKDQPKEPKVQEEPTPLKAAKTEPVQKETKKVGDMWHVQLFSSTDKAKVEKQWQIISRKQKALVSDMPMQIVRAEIAGKGIFYRLQVGTFETREMAVNLCAKLKKQKQDCIPAK